MLDANSSDLKLFRASRLIEDQLRNGLVRRGDTGKKLYEQSAEAAPIIRILYVEDSPDIGEVIIRFLTMEGYSTVLADSIAQAGEVIAAERFDLYLIGDFFPFGSNLELIRRIRTQDSHTPIILYSTQVFESYIERGKRAGAHIFIGKLAEIDQLLYNVRSLIGGPEHAHFLPGARSEQLY